MLRKSIGIVFVLILLLAASAAAQPVELTLLTHYSTHQEDALMEWVSLWNENNPDIQVVHQNVDFDQLLPTIMAQQTAGRGADIVHAYALWGGQMTRSNVLATPPAHLVADIRGNFAATAVQAVTFDDVVYGYPTEVQTYALFYNKAILGAAGYENPPETWEELEEIAAATTVYDGNTLVTQGFGLMTGWDSAVVHPFLSLAYASGAQLLDETNSEVLINSEAGVRALQFQKDLVDAGLVDTSINVLGAFPSEQLAMTINAGWWNGSLRNGMAERYENVGVAPIPSPDGERRGSVSYSWFFGVNNRSQNQEAAWQFLEWMNSYASENGATPMGNFMSGLGIIPARDSDLAALADDLAHPNNQPFINALEYAVPEPAIFAGQRIKTILQREIESVWAGQVSPEAALARAEQQIMRELSR